MKGWLRAIQRGFARSGQLPDAERARLEDWVRLRFRLEPADPTAAVIAASSRLIDAGMGPDEAVETVLRIVNEVAAERP